MKISKIPYLPGWIAAAGCFLLALVPSYAYVRLVPAAVGCVIGAFCAVGHLARRHREVARVLRMLLICLLIVGLCIGVVTGGGILLWAGQQVTPGQSYIVVLGAKVESGGPSKTLQERIWAAYEYLSQNPDTVAIVSGGQGGDEPMTEAACMYDALVALGIGPERVWIEDRATSTWENLQFSLDIIQQRTGQRPERIGVLSSEFHLFRVARYAYDWGLQVDGIPAKTTEGERWLHYFIREIAGVWHHLILGGEQG